MKSRCGFYSKLEYCEGVVEEFGVEVGELGGEASPPLPPVDETLHISLHTSPDVLHPRLASPSLTHRATRASHNKQQLVRNVPEHHRMVADYCPL